ncbi:MAG: flavin reductase family protein [Oscillospiraceae bacterium]
MEFTRIQPTEITDNMIKSISQDWMLITAGDSGKLNTMTASWGGVGELWGKHVAFCFVRPTRYTYGFMEQGDYYTLSFYDEKFRKQLQLCGSKSGRDVDKVKACGFGTEKAECGAPYFKEARLVLVCKKLYTDDIKPENFTDKTLDEKWYPEKDYHKVYVGEILEVLKK